MVNVLSIYYVFLFFTNLKTKWKIVQISSFALFEWLTLCLFNLFLASSPSFVRFLPTVEYFLVWLFSLLLLLLHLHPSVAFLRLFLLFFYTNLKQCNYHHNHHHHHQLHNISKWKKTLDGQFQWHFSLFHV